MASRGAKTGRGHSTRIEKKKQYFTKVARSKALTTVDTFGKKKKMGDFDLRDTKLFDLINVASSTMKKVEHKEVIPEFKGTDAPTRLLLGGSGYKLTETPTSLELRKGIRGMMNPHKVYPFRLSTVLNMSTNASGTINSTIAVSVVQSSTDFTSFGAIFDEFFVKSVHVEWRPIARYQYPLTGGVVPVAAVSSLPFGCACLQHTATAYTSLGPLMNNYNAKFVNTCDPFTYKWVNSENPRSGVDTSTSTSTSQGWISTNSGALYQGQLQFLSQGAPPGMPINTVAGVFRVDFMCLFRIRE